MDSSSAAVKKWLILLCVFMLAIFVGMFIGEQNLFYLVVTFAGIAFLLFLQNPQALAGLCIALYFSRITAPGIPGKLNLYYICASILIGIVLMQSMIVGFKRSQFSFAHACLVGFGIVVLLTMMVRGTGFRALGSDQWGGMVYVQLFVAIFMVFALPRAGLNNVWLYRALICMGIFSILPLIADIIVVAGYPQIWRFIQGNEDIATSLKASQSVVGKGVVRYHSGGVTGLFMLFSLLTVVDLKKLLSLRGMWLWPAPVICLGLVLISGHRLGIVIIGLFVLFLAFIQRAYTPVRIWLLCMVAICGWFVLVEYSAEFPEGVQRTISWVPGVDIPEYVQKDAGNTLTWRMELWTEALKRLPRYWLIGKGYAFSGEEMVGVAGANMTTAPLDWALISSSYHNGPISLLMGLGVFGLLTGCGFLIGALVRHRAILKRKWKDPKLKQCHQVVYAMFLTYVVIFFTLFGAVEEFSPFLFMFALLETLYQLDTSEKPAPKAG
jgi:O-antigen ligase/polysaccharide polymerase Wzy-like membrane protein